MTDRARRRLEVHGVVQGVGFRPFVYATATELGLSGTVANSSDGVVVEVEGSPAALDAFGERLRRRPPPLAVVSDVRAEEVPALGGTGFVIGPSCGQRARTLVSPDVAPCADCRRELADPADRRYRHPFLSCTNCGPRFTIVTGVPYDRGSTTMAGFPLCPACEREYTDPRDRRFHAQPICCHDCGPRLEFLAGGHPAAYREDALLAAREALAAGAIVAVKGLGGYHLACDATNENAVAELRRRKQRGDKPFAVMVAELSGAERLAGLDAAERELLSGVRRPVVLLERRPGAAVAESVAPRVPDLGVMLPYTPLHTLLLEGLPALVMTSGNLGGEPIVTDDAEALGRLAPLADAWLRHDRPIAVPCDDSVVRVVDGTELAVRRSRGYAPLPVRLPIEVGPALAVGADLKSTCGLAEGRYAWLSQHIGDMDDLATLEAFGAAETHLEALTGVRPEVLSADAHPGYRSSAWAREHAGQRPVRPVGHHHAHVAAVMGEHGLDGDEQVIGIAFDGTGYGDDGAVWGGEVLLADYKGYQRFAHLAYVPLAGGDVAVERPYRMALAHLSAAGLPWDEDLPCVAACPPSERAVLAHQLESGLACVPTSSVGRLFDAVAALIGVRQVAGYEAQAAIELEALARGRAEPGARTAGTEPDGGRRAPNPGGATGDGAASRGAEPGARTAGTQPDAGRRAPNPGGGAKPDRGPDAPRAGGAPSGSEAGRYEFAWADGESVFDAGPVIRGIVGDYRRGTAPARIAAGFHGALAQLVRKIAESARGGTGIETVALAGGVFQNVVLLRAARAALAADGFRVLVPSRLPPNDGGLALGQILLGS